MTSISQEPSGGTLESSAAAYSESQRGPLHVESILVPLDLSNLSLHSLRYAVPFARQFGARLTILHVVEPTSDVAGSPPSSTTRYHEPGAAQRRLEEIREIEIGPELNVKTVVRHGAVFDQIMSVARDECADLIVTTTHGHTGLQHLLMGSTAECIVHGAPCAVLVVRDRAKASEP